MPKGGEQIFYVDDEPDIVEMACDMLTKLGYRVTGNTDSLEALEVFKADPDRFDLLVTDQTMPGMTGGELLAAVQKCRPGMPVILCTGFSDKISGPDSRDGYDLPDKPYDMNTLACSVRKALD